MAFWGGRLDGFSEEELAERIEREYAETCYVSWFLFDVLIDGDRTVLDIFLERFGGRLSTAERAYLTQARGSHLRLYEVVEVAPGTGMRLTDLWSGEHVWVRERTATRSLVLWDLVGARVMPAGDGAHVLEGSCYVYPLQAKSAILRELRSVHRAFVRRSPGGDLGEFFKRAGILFHHFWLDHVVLAPPPRLLTAEGDDLVLARTRFDVRDAGAVRASLRGHPDLVQTEEDVFAWLEPGSGARRSLGTVRLTRGGLLLETMSRARAQRGRRMLEEAADEALRYRVTRYTQPPEMPPGSGHDLRVDSALVSPAALDEAPRSLSRRAEQRLLQELYARHYGAWPDVPLPALGGRTPRQAARSKRMRPRVVEVLKQMENGEARAALAGKAAYDLSGLWRELGLERPAESSSGRA